MEIPIPPPSAAQALVLFLKAPVPGRCKTRLIPPLTASQAAALYQTFCRDILRSAGGSGADLWITYQAHPDFPTPAWLASGLPFFEQQGKDLGERLIRAFDVLFGKGYARVAALGTDAPTLPPERLREAFAALERHDAVFGPAEDGGYYLAGLRRPFPALFRGIPWSTADVLPRTREILSREGIRAAFLPSHYDVDSLPDLRRLARDVEGPAAAACPETRACLAEWRTTLDAVLR